MSTVTKSGYLHVPSRLIAMFFCAFGLLLLCGCAGKPGDEGVVEHTLKYAHSRTMLDTTQLSVINRLPDAKVEISLMSLEETPDGKKEIVLEPSVISDTMASWSADEWAENRDDLYFNLAAHFSLICKQAHSFGDLPEGYSVSCPNYLTVYNSHKDAGFIVTSTGVFQKTDDLQDPMGEVIVLTSES